ncbi:DUF3916 domain-containing protein [Fictibacillus sp. 7GRE50]|uniref:DUF3916 domain-containing protein n=1 Tax=unclassified Fictibacillus TaxID=2644029 RepID=UPI0018CDF896|nr:MULTISPECIES: DUF3916 domain-containing protein [unclassified Fictibacillus]MBH0166796.1 DUF3916 domain-containing protein [Fictibacillus sp. 7GRE50]MBH0174221.1 DUF3916 domain-containing protein [Fictibacillus sp. 23RED33]
MNNWRFDNGSKKKLRGLKRRYKTLIKQIENSMKIMPDLNESSLGYWHEHLPFNQEYVDSKKTPNSIRRGIMQTLIDQVNHLISIKKEEQIDFRIYTVISLPSLFDSQIAVLPDKSWFEGFFERNSEEQKWIPLDKDRDLLKEWRLKAPSNLEVKGYKEIISDEDYYLEGEVWIIGELS